MQLYCITGKEKKLRYHIVILTFILGMISDCEVFKAKKKSDNSSALAAAFLASQGGCTSSTASSIGGSTRTSFNVSGTSCASGLAAIGFTGEGLTAGLTGSGTGSRLASTGTFSAGGEKKMNIEVTFLLTDSSGYLDVIGNASVSGAQATGPAIRLKSSGTDVLASGSSTGSAPDSGGNTAAGTGSEKTYCLEFHEENGTHLFGWPKSCASLSDSEKGSYTINKEGLTSANPGSRMGFILNKAVLKSFIVTSGKIGTAGSLQ